MPGASFYLAARWTEYINTMPDWHGKPFIIVPDLCVEIVSSNDNYQDIDAKVDRYLKDGVKLLWVVNPRNRSVFIYTAGSDQITRISEDATFTGGDLLPDFALPLHDIFPES